MKTNQCNTPHKYNEEKTGSMEGFVTKSQSSRKSLFNWLNVYVSEQKREIKDSEIHQMTFHSLNLRGDWPRKCSVGWQFSGQQLGSSDYVEIGN